MLIRNKYCNRTNTYMHMKMRIKKNTVTYPHKQGKT